MFRSWTSTLQVTACDVKLLVTTRDWGDLVRARLPLRPSHPRALLTLLEGLALWRGDRMQVVLAADDHYPNGLSSDLFGDELWPAESPLVHFEVAHRGRRAPRLRGNGDFRALYRAQGAS
jgi:hypothetical protein